MKTKYLKHLILSHFTLQIDFSVRKQLETKCIKQLFHLSMVLLSSIHISTMIELKTLRSCGNYFNFKPLSLNPKVDVLFQSVRGIAQSSSIAVDNILVIT